MDCGTGRLSSHRWGRAFGTPENTSSPESRLIAGGCRWLVEVMIFVEHAEREGNIVMARIISRPVGRESLPGFSQTGRQSRPGFSTLR